MLSLSIFATPSDRKDHPGPRRTPFHSPMGPKNKSWVSTLKCVAVGFQLTQQLS